MALNILPNAGQSLSVTRDPIRINFQTLNTCLQTDHIELDLAVPNSCKHKAVHLVNQSVAPAAPVTGAGELALYSAAVGGISQLFFKTENLGAGVDGINLTNTAGLASPGGTQLINGVILRWGSLFIPAGALSSGNVALPVIAGLPALTNVFSFIATPYGTSDFSAYSVSYAGPAPYTFKVTRQLVAPAGGFNHYYLIIGN